MRYFIFTKNELTSLIKNLFKFGKKELVFLAVVNTILFLSLFSLEFVQNNLSVLSPLFVIAVILIYKNITGCTKFDLFKVVFQWIIILEILGLFSNAYVLPYSENPLLLILAELLSSISFIIGSTIILIGLVEVLYLKKNDYKEILLITIISSLIFVFSSLHELYYTGLTLKLLLDIKFIIGTIAGILLFYSFNKIKDYISVKHKELSFFISLGLIIFLLEYLSGLFLIPSSVLQVEYVNLFELFIFKFEFFVGFTLWGVFLHFHNNRVTC